MAPVFRFNSFATEAGIAIGGLPFLLFSFTTHSATLYAASLVLKPRALDEKGSDSYE